MTQERWERIREWVDRLAELPPERRGHELDRISDPALRREVEAELDAREGSGDLVGQAAGAPSSHSDSLSQGRRDRIGQTISHYRIEKRLGGGGMGVVYRAQDLRLDRFVALKFLPPATDDDDERIKRLIVEARAASALDHPNICTIHQIDRTDDGHWFIVMAYYNGETLKKRIERGPMAIPEVLDFGSQIMSGLVKAHKEGIVHRDLKPANLMVTNENVVKIVDFGLAQLREQTKLTAPGTRLGTPAYMSPEQAQGQALDHRTDIWSLGIVLYEMLAGRAPFKGEYELAVIYSIVNEEPPPLEQLRPDASSSLLKLVKKALSKDPEDRYQQVEEVLRELERIKAGQAAHVREAPIPAPAERRGRPRYLYAAIVAAAAVVLAVLVALTMWTRQRSDSRGESPRVASVPQPSAPQPSASQPPAAEPVVPEPAAPEPAPQSAPPERSTPAAKGVPEPARATKKAAAATSEKTAKLEQRAALQPAAPAPPKAQTPAAEEPPQSRREVTPAEPAPAPPPQQPPQQAAPVDPATQELAEWMRIRESRDIAVFEGFLRSHPNGVLRKEAQSRMDDLKWETARASDDRAVIERYLRENPNSRYAAQARARLEELRPPAPAPAPPPAAEPAPVAKSAPPPRTPSEADAIRDVLKRYGEAYRARDAQQVAKLWPALSPEQVRRLSNSFRVAISIQQDLVPLDDPVVRGDQATVRCRRLIRYEDERGPQRPVDEEVNVVLRKQQGAWVIQAVN
jgi:serine/threonine protein kinase